MLQIGKLNIETLLWATLSFLDAVVSHDKYHLDWLISFAINGIDKHRRSKFSGV